MLGIVAGAIAHDVETSRQAVLAPLDDFASASRTIYWFLINRRPFWRPATVFCDPGLLWACYRYVFELRLGIRSVNRRYAR